MLVVFLLRTKCNVEKHAISYFAETPQKGKKGGGSKKRGGRKGKKG